MKHSMSTFVSLEVIDGNERKTIDTLWSMAAERLRGVEGLSIETINRVDSKLNATFTRNWEEADPEPEGVDPTP